MTFCASVGHVVFTSAYTKWTMADFLRTLSAVLVLFASNSEPKSFISTCSLYQLLVFKSLILMKVKISLWFNLLSSGLLTDISLFFTPWKSAEFCFLKSVTLGSFGVRQGISPTILKYMIFVLFLNQCLNEKDPGTHLFSLQKCPQLFYMCTRP